MDSNNSRVRGLAIVGLVLLAVATGAVAYNVGVSHGAAQQVVAQSAPAPGAQSVPPYAYPYPYPHGWYRPWGFGFFPILFFAFLWFAVIRGFFWGGRRPRGYYAGWRGVPPAFDEWHRQAHERLKEHPAADDSARRG